MKDDNPYFYLASSQLFPFTTSVPTDRSDTDLLAAAQNALELIESGNTAEALSLYTTVIEQHPQLPFFYACRSILNTHLEDEEGAFYDYQVAKKLDFNYHNFLEWQENKGAMLLAQELKEMNEEMKQHDASAQSFINRAMLWVQHFDYEQAIDDYSLALSIGDNADVRVSRAAVFMRMLHYDMALMDLNAAINLNPELHMAFLYRAKLFVAIREDKAALADFEHVLQLAPDNIEIFEERASYYEKINDWQAAIADYTQVITRNPTDFYCYVLRADAFEHIKDWHRAIADYDEAIRLNPHYSDLYQYRGELKKKIGDEDGASQDFNTFEELEQE
ncbi:MULTISPECIES: tetratricopeptide repeat protein [Sphingobacterium]|uniref:tetratricopeptide repeat protein n=1 Tax=Sphingobacterium TaxID=28453 RepID=UPI0013DD648B|nr:MULTISPECIES: tetratricopeptide repeat protein [unclassified Sphingobacterium]